MGCKFFWYRIDLTTYFVCNASKFCGFLGDPWLDDARQTTAHQIRAAEIKALKQISFPDMDSDGLPSSYTIKVVTCLGKWQMKMTDLSPATWCYQPNNETVSRLHAISSCMARIYALRMSNVDRLAFLVKIEIVELVKKNSYILYRLVFDFLSGWRQRLRPWFKTWASCLMRSARLIRLGLRKATLRSNLAYWNSQCVPLMKLYRVVHWSRCASGAICSKILDLNFSYILSNLLIEIRAPPASSIVFWKSEARRFFEAPVWKSENEVPRRPYGLVDVVEYTIYRYLSLKI